MADDTSDPSAQQSAYAPGMDYANRVIQIESNNDPNVVAGSNRGYGQFSPDLERRYGIDDSNRNDRGTQGRAIIQHAYDNQSALQRALGRPPTAGEYYLAHQQGVAGGPALVKADPNIPAWQAIRPYWRSDAMAKKAITGNIPKDDALYGVPVDQISAGGFRSMWTNRFERGLPGAQTASSAFPSPVATPVAVTNNAPQNAMGGLLGVTDPQAQHSLQNTIIQGAEGALQPPRLQPASPLAMRLAHAVGGTQIPMPPTVAQRLQALLSRNPMQYLGGQS